MASAPVVVVVQNPAPNAALKKLSNEPFDPSRKFEKFFYAPMPFCCVTKGSHETTVAEGEIMIRKNIAYCKTSVAMGAGYDVTRIPLDRLSRYSLHATRLLCLAPKQSISALVKPTGFEEHADIGPKDDVEFLTALDKHAPPARGRLPAHAAGSDLGSFVFKKRCGLNTTTLTLKANGVVTLEENQTGVTSIRELDCAFIEDLAFVRYTEAGLLQRLFCGGANRIEISFLADTYYMETMLPPDQLPLAHDAILTAALGRKQSPAMKVYEGKIGKLTLGPEFSTVEVVKMASIPLLMTKEVITIKTADVSHLRAGLPSWQNALLRAIRDIELVKLSRAISALMADDLVLLPVWPCSFFNDAYLTIVLAVKALVSIFNFLMIFFFRKTSVIFGGPGPAKQVAFLPNDKPEELLRGIASEVTAAQASFSWHTGGPAGAMLAGASKGGVGAAMSLGVASRSEASMSAGSSVTIRTVESV